MTHNGSGGEADVEMSDALVGTHECKNDESDSAKMDDVPISSTLNSSEENEMGGQSESIVSIDSAATATTPQQEQPPTQMLKLTSSRVPEIWSNFFRRLQKIENLEKRVNEHVSRSRRRIMNLLEQTPSHRRTNLRMFVSHFFDKFKGIWTLNIEGKLLVGNLDHVNATKVDMEGVLSARDSAEEKEERKKKKKSRSDDNLNSSPENLASSSGGSQSARTDLVSNTTTASIGWSPTLTSDRLLQSYRIGEKEEDPVPPLVFTHCFDKIEVTFRTIYQPRVSASAKSNSSSLSSSSSVKKSRSNKRKSSGQQSQDENVGVKPKLLKASDPTKLVWKKSDTKDAHAFFVKYNNHFSERPPPPGMRFHSVVAKVELYPTRPGTGVNVNKYQFQHQQDVNAEPLYQIVHPVLAKQFFPRHAIEGRAEVSKKSSDISHSKDNDSEGMKTDETAGDAQQQQQGPSFTSSDVDSIPLENDIQLPSFLTYDEISMSIFRYIQDNDLHDPIDRSTIICDKLLTEILDVESMSFGQLKQLLIQKNLIRRVGAPSSSEASSLSSSQKIGGNNNQKVEPVMPVVLTYVMNEQTTSPHVPTGYEDVSEKSDEILSPVSAANASAIAKRRAAYTTAEDPDHNPTVLSFDMDIAIPFFFNYRARDLLRRVKKREFEYTTCRTKARYLLVAAKGNEDMIKTRIEKAVSGQGYELENIPVFLALAKAAMPQSEARGAAQIDARTCDTVGRIEEASRNVDLAWEEADDSLDKMRG